MTFSKKKFNFILILFLIFYCLIEFALWLSLPFFLKDDRHYSKKIFKDLSWSNDNQLGWVAYNGKPRPSTNNKIHTNANEACVYVYGDSFVHADEVNNSEAWPNRLEKMLGCKVMNYGVGGYGTDQAFLRMQRTLPKVFDKKEKPIVLFGINQEMLRRNFAASWVYYGLPESKGSLRPYFSINKFRTGIELNNLPLKTDLPDIIKHHSKDRYRKLYNIQFPYFYTLLRNLYYRLDQSKFNEVAISIRANVYNDKDAIFIQTELMKKIIKEAVNKGFDLGFVYLATPAQTHVSKPPYTNFIFTLPIELKAKNHVFTIDTHKRLYEKSLLQKGVIFRAPGGHFNSLGNEIIAKTVYRSINNRQ